MSAAHTPSRAERPLRIGMLRLTDSAPLVVAEELSLFAEEGVAVAIFVEPSWANIADKLVYGFLDGAILVPPLAFAIDLGLRGVAQPLVVPMAISLGGNAIAMASEAAAAVRSRAEGDRGPLAHARALAHVLAALPQPATFGVVHAFSTHNLILRYWLAAAGVDLDQIRLAVVPPALAVEALANRQIIGFCAGAPWGEAARRAGVGEAIAASGDVWRSAPEKALAVRASLAQEEPDRLRRLLRALLRAAQICDQSDNSAFVASLLSRNAYVNLDRQIILPSLPGGHGPEGARMSFFRSAATFPWRSHALWFLVQLRRWGLLARETNLRAEAQRVYRPDLYRDAAASLGIAAPTIDQKAEGVHAQDWAIAASPYPIAMGPDLFCDGAVFAPDEI